MGLKTFIHFLFSLFVCLMCMKFSYSQLVLKERLSCDRPPNDNTVGEATAFVPCFFRSYLIGTTYSKINILEMDLNDNCIV